jgi:hypothetical protein
LEIVEKRDLAVQSEVDAWKRHNEKPVQKLIKLRHEENALVSKIASEADRREQIMHWSH